MGYYTKRMIDMKLKDRLEDMSRKINDSVSSAVTEAIFRTVKKSEMLDSVVSAINSIFENTGKVAYWYDSNDEKLRIAVLYYSGNSEEVSTFEEAVSLLKKSEEDTRIMSDYETSPGFHIETYDAQWGIIHNSDSSIDIYYNNDARDVSDVINLTGRYADRIRSVFSTGRSDAKRTLHTAIIMIGDENYLIHSLISEQDCFNKAKQALLNLLEGLRDRYEGRENTLDDCIAGVQGISLSDSAWNAMNDYSVYEYCIYYETQQIDAG